MNQDQVDGVVRNTAGKAQQETGKHMGNKEQQINALGNKMAGEFDRIFGNAKEVIKEVIKQV